MLVQQVYCFIENKSGRLSEIADVLSQNNININALQLADASEYGVLRMIVNDPEKAKQVLRDSGVMCKVSTALAIAIDDVPGGFAKALHLLTDEGIDVKYMYACISNANGKALMIVSVDDPQSAEEIIKKTAVGAVNPGEIYRI